MNRRIAQKELTKGFRLYVRDGWARLPVTVLDITAERIVVCNAAGLRKESTYVMDVMSYGPLTA
jgi:hypothetical protein